jgi:4-oxalomesaconate tautomerase
MLLRGGSSKGAYFLAGDLPPDPAERDDLLLRILGSPDSRQIDGIGGAHPLTSKVAVVSRSARPEVDLDYLFLQVGVDEASVSDGQNCGNLLAGVAPFAIERGLVPRVSGVDGDVGVRVFMANTDSVAVATVRLDDGRPVYDGDTAISGVPGTAAPIRLDFADVAGGSCGALLPTGRAVDVVSGVACTLIDNGMPVVVLRADAVGVSGDESCAELEADVALRATLEAIRLRAGRLMNLGDVTKATVPKLTLVSAPAQGGDLNTRTFIPHRCHDAIGVLGALSVATAAVLPGSPAAALLGELGIAPAAGVVTLEHPTGRFTAAVTFGPPDASGLPSVERAGFIRTARKLMDGLVFPRPSR